MRFRRELAVVVALFVLVGALARTGAGRFVLPVVSLGVAVALGVLLLKQPAYSRTTFGPRTRILESTPNTSDAVCVECGSPATTLRHYVREWVVLGVPVVLLDDGKNPVCDDHRD
ncbi:hypothetical protein E6P09_03855 [Haloferax mediterranei ATCC 33500]|uniref:DUF8108 domain-containing protein n=1 Tax=Haloferax mediterranei (strain ATCC 33500 / DSM 1411 / JCM 8866 / NBRC 14739 / NCIMB 2177 / R-4) TaxID=523841 RepID=I3R0Y2_HALMT|nr:hypothetical protein [Haloferax mediterranei]AFK17892.1 hypothetical protein HFX_0151 [Haloferax mediterranei ATCC 33500]AHZ22684.1 hypothetical protein BM92_08510 [Haloferax mediterranei ATCC 33500]EMA02833.1 hypothetical protein C439_09630 [Haloferax mediterranei ATCC 33500]MDX5987983.1 hypothetical protein [Haloferax mediterranei ATCC 33500]QCQ74451.1 hypothetical protein E6P09_03855 [Haloferax mediterranei ATCC 33500]